MKITRDTKSYDEFKIEASYSEIKAMRAGLAGEGSTVISDEVLKAIDWYLDRLPPPGEEEEQEPEVDADELKPVPADDDDEPKGEEAPKTEPAPANPEIRADFDLDLTDLDSQLPSPSGP